MADWNKLLEEHGPSVWRSAYRLLGNAHDAEECLQEVFLSAWRLSQKEPIRRWGPLLRRLASRRALDLLRRRMAQTDSTGSKAPAEVAPALRSNPEQSARAEELGRHLRAALAALPDDQAQAFFLCCIEDLKYHEAAGVMNVAPNNVGVLVHRARARLRELLSKVVDE